MENIKLYINASIDDVKIYLGQLIDTIDKRNPKFIQRQCLYPKYVNI